jgi:hypothetical protein
MGKKALLITGSLLLLAACPTPSPSPAAQSSPPATSIPALVTSTSAPKPLIVAGSASSSVTKAPYQPISLAAVGDLMLGSTYPDKSGGALPPNDGRGLLTHASKVLQAADIAFGNLEAPLYDGGTTPFCTVGAIAERYQVPVGKATPGKSCWAFRTPVRFAERLSEAGFDVLSLANNHVDDFGPVGRASTIAKLKELHIAYSGPVGSVAHFQIRGTKIDVIAFATNPNLNSMLDIPAAKTLIAKSAAEADIVVVSFHGGAEGTKAQHVPQENEMFWGESRGAVRAFAHAAVDAGADLLLGHGPHVLRGMEMYKKRLIAYSLGSFATYRGIRVAGVLGRTLILTVKLTADGEFLSGYVIPMRQKTGQGPAPDTDVYLIPVIQSLSREDFGNNAPLFGINGKIGVRKSIH